MKAPLLHLQHMADVRPAGLDRDAAAWAVAEIERLWALCERLKMEAVCQAQEARTANATIAEIYQLVSGRRGEPGNWNGAAPVAAELARLRAAGGPN